MRIHLKANPRTAAWCSRCGTVMMPLEPQSRCTTGSAGTVSGAVDSGLLFVELRQRHFRQRQFLFQVRDLVLAGLWLRTFRYEHQFQCGDARLQLITLDVHGYVAPSRSPCFSRGTGLAYGEVYHRAVSGKSKGPSASGYRPGWLVWKYGLKGLIAANRKTWG